MIFRILINIYKIILNTKMMEIFQWHIHIYAIRIFLLKKL